MHQTALVIVIAEAESRFAAMRSRFDPQANLGVPAHITILFPFMAPELVDSEVRRRLGLVFQRFVPFRCVLDRVGRFPETAYLAPIDAAPFIALTEAVAAEFPQYPPYAGAHSSILPHLTIASGDAHAAASAEQQLRSALEADGPVLAACRAVTLLENSSGRWAQMDDFALQGDTP